MNSWETAVDCGGGCKGCSDNSPCYAGQDCKNGVCLFRNAYATTVEAGQLGGACKPATCSDFTTNGAEADVDCGDTACCAAYKVKSDCPWHCNDGYSCNSVYDCKSQRCYRNVNMNGARYCSAARVSDAKPEYSTRVTGGVTIYGPRKLLFDPSPVKKALAFMLNVPAETIVMDALVDVQRSREFGNWSYYDVRIAKGWQPGGPYRRLQPQQQQQMPGHRPASTRHAEAPMAAASPGPDDASALPQPQVIFDDQHVRRIVKRRRAPSGWRRVVRIESSAPATDDANAIRGLSSGPFDAARRNAVAGPLSSQSTQQQRRRRQLRQRPADEHGIASFSASSTASAEFVASSSSTSADQSSEHQGPTRPSFALEYQLGAGKEDTWTEFELDLAARHGPAAVEDYRQWLHADIDGLTLDDHDAAAGVPGGTGVRALQSLALPRYNMTLTDTVIGINLRYMIYAQPYEATLIQSRITKLLNYSLLPGGWTAESALEQQLEWLDQDRTYCLTWLTNYTLEQFNTTGVDCSPYVSLSNGTDANTTSSSSSDSQRRLLHHEHGSRDGRGDQDRHQQHDADAIKLHPLSHPSSYLHLPHVRQGLIEHVRRDCFDYVDELTGVPGRWCRSEEGKDTPRSTSDTAAQHGNGRLAPSSPVAEEVMMSGPGRRRLGIIEDHPGGRGLQPSAAAGILSDLPRVGFGDMLLYYGCNWDTARGIWWLTDGALDTNSDPPSSFYQPAAIVVTQDPRGLPSKPLYMGDKFPQQPVVKLVDRHWRMVTSFAKPVAVTAYLDTARYPPDGLNPMLLTGFKVPTVGANGYAVYDDLTLTEVTQGLVINFTSTFVTSLNQRIVMSGATRPFDVIEPPLKPVIVYIRVPLDPLLVGFLTISGALFVTAFMYAFTVCLRWLRTPRPRVELTPLQKKTAGNDGLGLHDGYRPNQDLEDHGDDGDDDVNAAVTEAENGDLVHEPPPPVYTKASLPGIGPSFEAAFGHLEDQLSGVEDGDLVGQPDVVAQEVGQYMHDVEPEVIAAEREVVNSAMVAEQARHKLAAKTLNISVMGRQLASIPAGRVAAAVLGTFASLDRKLDREVLAASRHAGARLQESEEAVDRARRQQRHHHRRGSYVSDGRQGSVYSAVSGGTGAASVANSYGDDDDDSGSRDGGPVHHHQSSKYNDATHDDDAESAVSAPRSLQGRRRVEDPAAAASSTAPHARSTWDPLGLGSRRVNRWGSLVSEVASWNPLGFGRHRVNTMGSLVSGLFGGGSRTNTAASAVTGVGGDEKDGEGAEGDDDDGGSAASVASAGSRAAANSGGRPRRAKHHRADHAEPPRAVSTSLSTAAMASIILKARRDSLSTSKEPEVGDVVTFQEDEVIGSRAPISVVGALLNATSDTPDSSSVQGGSNTDDDHASIQHTGASQRTAPPPPRMLSLVEEDGEDDLEEEDEEGNAHEDREEEEEEVTQVSIAHRGHDGTNDASETPASSRRHAHLTEGSGTGAESTTGSAVSATQLPGRVHSPVHHTGDHESIESSSQHQDADVGDDDEEDDDDIEEDDDVDDDENGAEASKDDGSGDDDDELEESKSQR